MIPRSNSIPTAKTRGRPRASTREHLESVALELFECNGYADTSIDDIARAAQISRSTVFRYASSKAQLLWLYLSDYEDHLTGYLAEPHPGMTLTGHLGNAIIRTFTFQTDQGRNIKRKLQLIYSVDELLHIAYQLRMDWSDDLVAAIERERPQLRDQDWVFGLAQALINAGFAAQRRWAELDDDELESLIPRLRDALDPLLALFAPALDPMQHPTPSPAS